MYLGIDLSKKELDDSIVAAVLNTEIYVSTGTIIMIKSMLGNSFNEVSGYIIDNDIFGPEFYMYISISLNSSNNMLTKVCIRKVSDDLYPRIDYLMDLIDQYLVDEYGGIDIRVYKGYKIDTNTVYNITQNTNINLDYYNHNVTGEMAEYVINEILDRLNSKWMTIHCELYSYNDGDSAPVLKIGFNRLDTGGIRALYIYSNLMKEVTRPLVIKLMNEIVSELSNFVTEDSLCI